MVVYRYIAASTAGRSTAEAHGLEPDSTTKSTPLREKSGADVVMMDHIIVGRVMRYAAGGMSAWMMLMAGKQLSPFPSRAGAHGGVDGADVAMDCRARATAFTATQLHLFVSLV